MKCRVVYRVDGGISVIHPAPKSKRPEETEEQWLERVFSKAMQGELKDLPYDDIDSSELPQSREDRNAWIGEKDKGISIDQVKAAKLRADKEREKKIQKKLREMAIREIEKEKL